MMTNEQAKMFLSVNTHNKITKLLYTLEHVKTPRDIAKAQENLREMIEELFTYKEIFDLHSDHILELAETVAGLYPERNDLNDYVYYILDYINKKLTRYEEKKSRYKQDLRQMEKIREIDRDRYLNLRYTVWTYTDGYYCQQAHMYRLLNRTLKELLSRNERGTKCRKKVK